MSRPNPALRALRLNLYFPPWRELARHLDSTAIRPAGHTPKRCPRSGWPHADEWLRVQVDHELAEDLLARMEHLSERVPDKAAYLRRLASRAPMTLPAPSASLVTAGPPARWEYVIDWVELALPSFVRWTLRVDVDGPSPEIDLLRDVLGERPVAEAWRLLRDFEGLDVVELVRGEVGPVLHEGHGPWISAVLSRATRGGGPVRVDDPIARDLPIPTPSQRFSLSRHRKWAAPSDDVKDLRRWLTARGSRNLVYSYTGSAE